MKNPLQYQSGQKDSDSTLKKAFDACPCLLSPEQKSRHGHANGNQHGKDHADDADNTDFFHFLSKIRFTSDCVFKIESSSTRSEFHPMRHSDNACCIIPMQESSQEAPRFMVPVQSQAP
jgi:hypothetical protein